MPPKRSVPGLAPASSGKSHNDSALKSALHAAMAPENRSVVTAISMFVVSAPVWHNLCVSPQGLVTRRHSTADERASHRLASHSSTADGARFCYRRVSKMGQVNQEDGRKRTSGCLLAYMRRMRTREGRAKSLRLRSGKTARHNLPRSRANVAELITSCHVSVRGSGTTPHPTITGMSSLAVGL